MTSAVSSHFKVKDLSFINSIKSMAIIGTSAKRNFFFLKNHQESFKGSLYAVNPTVTDIPDFPRENIYKSIKEIPEDIDFVFITVPAKHVLSVIDECIEISKDQTKSYHRAVNIFLEASI